MTPTIVRHAYLPQVTLGNWFIDDFKFAALEEPWKRDPDGPGGQRRETGLPESCIPDGLYNLHHHVSPHYPDGVYAFVNPILGVYAPGTRPAGQAWGRDAVLVHPGNTLKDTLGCVLIGLRHELIDGKWEVRESRAAMQQLKTILGTKNLPQIYIRPTAGSTEL